MYYPFANNNEQESQYKGRQDVHGTGKNYASWLRRHDMNNPQFLSSVTMKFEEH